MKNIAPMGYESISEEYYVETLHPTSNNFRDASGMLLDHFMGAEYKAQDRILEVGAGRSLVAEWLQSRHFPLTHLVLTDLSPSMLAHSGRYQLAGCRMEVLGAEHIATRFSNLDMVISLLGDPYNVPAFWESSFRSLTKGGYCIFTTPSWEWAGQFRLHNQPDDNEHAHFLLKTGDEVHVPSFIYPAQPQIEMAMAAGFFPLRTKQVFLQDLRGEISWKLQTPVIKNYPVLTGYLLQKP